MDTVLREKLLEAIYTLATGKGPIQERLRDAHICIRLDPDDLPEPMQSDYEILRRELLAQDAAPFQDPSVKALRLSPERASEMAHIIVSMYLENLSED